MSEQRKRTPLVLLSLWLIFIQTDVCQCGVVITKSGVSEDDCITACLNTAEVDCNYYKFSKSRSTCYLTNSPDPAVTGMKKVEKPEPGPAKKPASSWVSQLQGRILALEQRDLNIKKLHKDITDMKAEIASLKNSRALTHHLLRTSKEQEDQNVEAVDEKAEILKSEMKRLEDAVMTLGNLQKTFAEKIKKVNDAQKTTGLSLAMISQSNKDMRSSVRELAGSMSDVKTELNNVRKMLMELEVRFAGLSTDVMEKSSNFDSMFGPELTEIKDSQTTLAEALSLLTKKIMDLGPRIPYMQKRLGANQGRVNVVVNKMEDLRRELGLMNERIAFTEENLKKFVDPASPINMERRVIMTHLRGQVATLEDGQKRTKQDLMAEISDRNNLYRELSGLKVKSKALVEKVISLELAIRMFRHSLRELIMRGPHAKLVERMLARQIKEIQSLQALKKTQEKVRDALEEYKNKLEKNSKAIQTQHQQHNLAQAAFRELQRKLIMIYLHLREQVPDTMRTKQIDILNVQQEHTLKQMGKMQQLQSSLQRDLADYKANIDSVARQLRVEMDIKEEIVDQLDDLRVNTTILFNALRSKLIMLYQNHELSESKRHKALVRLKALTKAQKLIVAYINHYHGVLEETRNELSHHEGAQQEAAQKVQFLHSELEKLNEDLQHLMGTVRSQKSVQYRLVQEKEATERMINEQLQGQRDETWEALRNQAMKQNQLLKEAMQQRALLQENIEQKAALNQDLLHQLQQQKMQTLKQTSEAYAALRELVEQVRQALATSEEKQLSLARKVQENTNLAKHALQEKMFTQQALQQAIQLQHDTEQRASAREIHATQVVEQAILKQQEMANIAKEQYRRAQKVIEESARSHKAIAQQAHKAVSEAVKAQQAVAEKVREQEYRTLKALREVMMKHDALLRKTNTHEALTTTFAEAKRKLETLANKLKNPEDLYQRTPAKKSRYDEENQSMMNAPLESPDVWTGAEDVNREIESQQVRNIPSKRSLSDQSDDKDFTGPSSQGTSVLKVGGEQDTDDDNLIQSLKKDFMKLAQITSQAQKEPSPQDLLLSKNEGSFQKKKGSPLEPSEADMFSLAPMKTSKEPMSYRIAENDLKSLSSPALFPEQQKSTLELDDTMDQVIPVPQMKIVPQVLPYPMYPRQTPFRINRMVPSGGQAQRNYVPSEAENKDKAFLRLLKSWKQNVRNLEGRLQSWKAAESESVPGSKIKRRRRRKKLNRARRPKQSTKRVAGSQEVGQSMTATKLSSENLDKPKGNLEQLSQRNMEQLPQGDQERNPGLNEQTSREDQRQMPRVDQQQAPSVDQQQMSKGNQEQTSREDRRQMPRVDQQQAPSVDQQQQMSKGNQEQTSREDRRQMPRVDQQQAPSVDQQQMPRGNQEQMSRWNQELKMDLDIRKQQAQQPLDRGNEPVGRPQNQPISTNEGKNKIMYKALKPRENYAQQNEFQRDRYKDIDKFVMLNTLKEFHDLLREYQNRYIGKRRPVITEFEQSPEQRRFGVMQNERERNISQAAGAITGRNAPKNWRRDSLQFENQPQSSLMENYGNQESDSMIYSQWPVVNSLRPWNLPLPEYESEDYRPRQATSDLKTAFNELTDQMRRFGGQSSTQRKLALRGSNALDSQRIYGPRIHRAGLQVASPSFSNDDRIQRRQLQNQRMYVQPWDDGTISMNGVLALKKALENMMQAITESEGVGSDPPFERPFYIYGGQQGAYFDRDLNENK